MLIKIKHKHCYEFTLLHTVIEDLDYVYIAVMIVK